MYQLGRHTTAVFRVAVSRDRFCLMCFTPAWVGSASLQPSWDQLWCLSLAHLLRSRCWFSCPLWPLVCSSMRSVQLAHWGHVDTLGTAGGYARSDTGAPAACFNCVPTQPAASCVQDTSEACHVGPLTGLHAAPGCFHRTRANRGPALEA